MSITSGKVMFLMGLAAIALAACGGGDTTSVNGDPSGGAGAADSASAGGEGGSKPMLEVDTYDCNGVGYDVTIKGNIDDLNKYYESYQPSELTIKVGDVLLFIPYDSVQNMESGVYPMKDGKFHTPQGWGYCLVFHVPGTYPFFSLGAGNAMTGILHVE